MTLPTSVFFFRDFRYFHYYFNNQFDFNVNYCHYHCHHLLLSPYISRSPIAHLTSSDRSMPARREMVFSSAISSAIYIVFSVSFDLITISRLHLSGLCLIHSKNRCWTISYLRPNVVDIHSLF